MILDIIDKVLDGLQKLPRIVILIGVAVLIAIVAAVSVPAVLMSRPAFFANREGLGKSFESLKTSAHAGLKCADCHAEQGGTLVSSAVRAGRFYQSLLPSKDDSPKATMTRPTSEMCAKCHERDWSYHSDRIAKVPHPAHLRVSSETRDCVKCHKWTAHQEESMEKHKTMPFSGVCVAYGCHVGWKQKEDCAKCHHSLEKKKGAWRKAHPQVVLASGDRSCLESCHEVKQCRLCHTTGRKPKLQGIAVETELKEIQARHAKPDWISNHGTVALPDQSKCLRCHVSLAECQSCHSRRPAFHGSQDSWIGTHKNVAKKKDDRRCLTCHEKQWCEACHAQFKEMR